MPSVELDESKPLVVVVGAGLGGIYAGIALKKQLKYKNFIILEKASEVGGTWRENTYPGCGCDVPSHWYSISTDPNPNWTTTYSPQPEIHNYLKDVTKRHDLYSHIRFNNKLTKAVWDADKNHYVSEITVTDPATGDKSIEHINIPVIISAIGGLHIPMLPDIKGLDTFKGDMWHSAVWRHDISLKGKRVGIIGNGCSSCQIVPAISKDPEVTVINFCRTPAWFAPRIQYKYFSVFKWIWAYIPGVHALFRFMIYLYGDLQYNVWKKGNRWMRALSEYVMKKYITSQAPPHMLDKLIPKYPLGCKRIIRDPGYLKSLHQENVHVVWESIQEVTPEGILTKDGTLHKLDILIPATGFDTTAGAAPPVTGQNGKTILDYFAENSGPTAYMGTTMPGFPNLFIILGPNVASGHGSAIFVEEVQVNYAVQMIKKIVDERTGVKAVEIKDTATDVYNTDLQKRLSNTVWNSCFSYYNQQGGKNVSMYPGFVTQFWMTLRKPIWTDYSITGAGGKKVTL